ncbi:PAS domain S-box protein [Fischerella sp. PCC 9605]|uniref:PAS domain S-box protein n=1 Tax=Fischerella sp. PCC 9605 TaxID=1173024 RepID=UPI0004B18A62|nr:PAS domain S-box protein [Fischerella sp. PCC 9605]
MSEAIRNRLLPYGVTALGVAVALLFMQLLNPWLPMTQSPFLLFFAAVTVSAWYGGRGPGIFATLLSALFANYFFIVPVYKFTLDPLSFSRLLIYILESILISVLCGALRTAQQRTQKSLNLLKVSEAKFRRLVDSNIIGVVFADTRGAITEANDAFLKMTGYTREDVLTGRVRWDEMTPPDLSDLDAHAIEEIMTTGKCTPFEKAYFHKDGHRIPILVGAALLEDESRENVISFILDLSDRKQAEQRQRVQYAVTRVLAEARTIADAVPAVLRSLCESLGWQLGIFWSVDRQGEFLGYVNEWHVPSVNLDEFKEKNQTTIFTPGVGLPGRVWASGEPAWIEDVIADHNFPRIAEATQAGLHGALAFPIRINREILGAIECFSDKIQKPDADLLQMMSTIGSEIGQFIERKRAEEALAESQRLFSSFMNHMPGCAYIKDEQGRYLFANPIGAGLVNLQVAKVLGKTDFDILPQEVAQPLRDNDITVLTTGKAIQKIETLPQSDGEHCWMSFKFPIKDASGKQMLAGMSFDITEQKRTEAAITELNKDLNHRVSELQTLLDVIPIAIGIGLDPKCRDIRVNSVFARWLNVPTGVNVSTIQVNSEQLPFKICRHGEELPPDEQPMRYAATHGVEVRHSEIEIVCDNGAIHHLLGNAAPLFDEEGRVRGSVGAFLDISDRKRTEAIFRFLAEASSVLASSLDYQTTLENIARLAVLDIADWCAIDVLDENSATSRLAAIHGHPDKVQQVREFIRNYPLDLNSSHPIARVLRTGESELVTDFLEPDLASIAGDEEHYRKLQALHIKSYICVPLIARGQILGAITLVYGESGRRYSVTDLSLAEDLARRAALAVDNARLYRKAQEANQIKDEFLAVLSHELRSPLNPILGWTKILQSRKLDEAATLNALKTIERNAHVQVQIIEDLLDISRIIQGKLSLDVSPVNLASTIEAAIETVRLAAEVKSIEINFQKNSSETLFVLGDSSRLQQVIWNLLSNAVKFTPNQGRVEILIECSNADAHIKISDTGKGINPDFLPYVFDYFRQENSATNRQFGGLGLGLAIVRRLVELHGGTVKAESSGEGLGATFTITLPLMTTVQKTRQENDNSDTSPILKGIRVLAVDDDPDNLELIVFLLEQYGIEVRSVTSAVEALSVLIEWQPNLLLSDIGMPDVDGYTLIRQIRALPPEQGGTIPAIALTAYTGEINHQQALSAGFQQHVSKPVNPEELALAITKAVGGSKEGNG